MSAPLPFTQSTFTGRPRWSVSTAFAEVLPPKMFTTLRSAASSRER
jgi:hypothetical protein